MKREFSCEATKIISIFIVNTFGLHFQPQRENDLMRAVRAAALQFDCKDSVDDIKSWLCDKTLTESEMRVLSEQLTINETYFFREKTALELLSQTIIPAILKKRDINKQPVRIWSAGCSSGEEAYSIAMWLSGHFNELNHHNLQIIATDISPGAIAKALKGEYTEWSFRETSSELKAKYFIRSGNSYRINTSIQKYVQFGFLNLAKNCFPSSLTNTENIDVVFCRNVLMYFSPDKIREVSHRFNQALNSDGWLITSQVELNDDYFGRFFRVQFNNGIFYSKNKCAVPELRVRIPAPKPVKQIQTKELKVNIKSTKKTAQESIGLLPANGPITVPKPKAPAEATLINLQIVREMSNSGNYETAVEMLQNMINSEPENAELYYMLANILYEKNESELAEKMLIKTLYLNQNHLNATLLMAYLLKQRKQYVKSSVYFKQAIEILDNNPTEVNVNNEFLQLQYSLRNELSGMKVAK